MDRRIWDLKGAADHEHNSFLSLEPEVLQKR